MMIQSPPAPRVLVLLATYNGAPYIAEQIASLSAQRNVRLRVLASDDGSTDDTVDIASTSAARGGLPLRFLSWSFRSGSSTQNFLRLFRAANFDDCDYVALCDQDDIWVEEKMHRATESLENLVEGGYSCNSIAFWPDGSQKKIKKDYPQRQWDYLFESASHGCTYVMTVSTARRFKEFLATDASGFKGIEFHDMLIYAWARSNRVPWIMDGRHLIRYRQTGRNVIGANFGVKAALSRLRLLREGWLHSQSLYLIDVLGMEGSPMAALLKRYRFGDRMRLAILARQCRRRPRDAVVFFLTCVLGGHGRSS